MESDTLFHLAVSQWPFPRRHIIYDLRSEVNIFEQNQLHPFHTDLSAFIINLLYLERWYVTPFFSEIVLVYFSKPRRSVKVTSVEGSEYFCWEIVDIYLIQTAWDFPFYHLHNVFLEVNVDKSAQVLSIF